MKRTILIFSLILSVISVNSQTKCPSRMTDSEGNKYKTVLIGQQCWMAENLRATIDRNGNAIPHGSGDGSAGAHIYNPNDSSANVVVYGYLYNWSAALRACPNGWHLPTDDEWTQLTDYVNSQPRYCCGTVGGNGKALAAKTLWMECADQCTVGNHPAANNATGFGALPAGGFYGDRYGYFGKGTFFWSATESGEGKAYKRYLDYNKDRMVRTDYHQYGGGAVRCVKD